MDLLQRRLDPLEEAAVAGLGLPAHLAQVVVVHPPIEHVLEALPLAGQTQLLDDPEPLERLEVPIDARAIDGAGLRVDERVDLRERDPASLVVEDVLEEQPPPLGDPHAVAAEHREEVSVAAHIARCCNKA